MNPVYRLMWNGTGEARVALKGLVASLILTISSNAFALPAGGTVAAGGASIAGGPGTVTITQSSQNVAINWQSFSIGQTEAVRFVQPGSSSLALNRVLGANPSSILGSLSANGKVFLVNPNGILFGNGAQVNVGGLVASTRNITDGDFMAGNHKFSGTGGGAVRNLGSINADGGYVALLGANVSNEGVISARLGTVALAAGNAFTLDVAGDGLLNVMVNQGALNALVQNGGLIRADGGQVLLTAQAAGNLLQTLVNNTGVIQAQTVENRSGTIKLLADMQSGTVNVGGTLDASAPIGGNGGFIESSAANVQFANDARITTFAPMGLTGTLLIDPQDFFVSAAGNITGPALSLLLRDNSVIISTNIGPDTSVVGAPFTRNTSTPGNGDIFVNQALTWTAAGAPTTLTLNAAQDVNLNSAIVTNTGNLVVCCGRDVNVNAAITTVNGSILLAGGRNVNLNAAITTTDGNFTACAGHDVNVRAAITLTRGSSIPGQSLGLPLGLVLSAGNDGTGPGIAGGTVVVAPLTPPAAVTGPNAPVTVIYNPVSYAAPTNYLPNFTLVTSTLTQKMLVFPDGASKAFDGTTTATFTSLKGAPAGVLLVALPGSTAAFDTAAVGVGKTVSFTGFTLAGANSGNFALPASCCGPVVGRTTASITPVAVVVPPVIVVAPPDVEAPDVEAPDVVAVDVVAPDVVAVDVAAPGGAIPDLAAALPLVQHTVGSASPLNLPGLNLSVLGGGITMPPMTGARAETKPETPPVVAPPETPQIYVPPQRPRKPDRN